jgi:hypothetical protein
MKIFKIFHLASLILFVSCGNDSLKSSATFTTVEDRSLAVDTRYLGRVCPPPSVSFDLADQGLSGNFEITSNLLYGSATISAGVLTYSPNPGVTAVEQISYSVTNDSSENIVKGVLIITITGDDYSIAQNSSSTTIFEETFNYDATNPLHTSNQTSHVSVVKNHSTGQWEMFTEHLLSGTRHLNCSLDAWGISKATSTDGRNWTPGTLFVLDPDDFGSCAFVHPDVIWDGQKYHMFVATYEPSTASNPNMLKYFSSTDGDNWSYQATLTETSVNTGTVFSPTAVLNNGEFYVIAANTSQTGANLYYTSSNQSSWSTSASFVFNSSDSYFNDGGFTADKYYNTSLICSNKPGEQGLIAFPVYRNSTVSTFKSGSVYSTDGLSWSLSSHITPVLLTEKDQTSNNGWAHSTNVLSINNDYIIYATGKDDDDTSKKTPWIWMTNSSWPF